MKKIKIKTGPKVSADAWVKEKESKFSTLKEKQINFIVPEDLHYRFNVACTISGVTMKEVMVKSMEDYILNGPKLPPVKQL
jgi:glutamate/tyrosine decarboxylase-like PLP-dependent enzyme